MKKFRNIFVAMMAIMCTAVVCASCSDEKEEPATPAAKLIEGTYSGDMDCSVMGSVSTFENLAFAVKAVDEATVSVVLPAFGEAPMALPSITLDGVKVSEADGVVTLATTEVSGQTDSGRSYTCTFAGSVESNTLNIKFNLQYGAMPMPMICTAAAKKQ